MLKEWLEKNFQEPFFVAEMAKAQASLVRYEDADLGTVKALAVFGTVYMAFCAYWFARYIVG